MHIDYAIESLEYGLNNNFSEVNALQLICIDQVLELAKKSGDQKISDIASTMIQTIADRGYKKVTKKQQYVIANFLLTHFGSLRKVIEMAFDAAGYEDLSKLPGQSSEKEKEEDNMNLEEFKLYAVANANEAYIEISQKNIKNKALGKVDYFSIEMEKNMIKTKERVLKMVESLDDVKYSSNKTKMILALSTDRIKAQCHKEVFNK